MLLHHLQQGHDCVPLTRPSGSRQCSGWGGGGWKCFPFWRQDSKKIVLGTSWAGRESQGRACRLPAALRGWELMTDPCPGIRVHRIGSRWLLRLHSILVPSAGCWGAVLFMAVCTASRLSAAVSSYRLPSPALCAVQLTIWLLIKGPEVGKAMYHPQKSLIKAIPCKKMDVMLEEEYFCFPCGT